MIQSRIKIELLRSIGIFGIAMFFFLFISINLNDYYWLTFVGPILVIILYITIIFFWVKNNPVHHHNKLLKHHRILVGSIIFIFFLMFSLIYLLFFTEFNNFLKYTVVIFIFSLGLSIIFVFLNWKKIKNETKNKKELLKIQKQLALREILIGGILVFILGIYIILTSFTYILWIIPLVSIPVALCIEFLDKKLFYEITKSKK